MGLTESISIFNATTIAKNASTNSLPINMQKFGPNDTFYPYLLASGGGNVAVHYKLGLTKSGSFVEPGNATNIGIQKSSLQVASLDFHPAFTPQRAPWMKFMAQELNASPCQFTMDLIVSKE